MEPRKAGMGILLQKETKGTKEKKLFVLFVSFCERSFPFSSVSFLSWFTP